METNNIEDNYIEIKKEFKFENKTFFLEISYDNSKLNIYIEKKEKMNNEYYKNSYSINKLQGNKYFKNFQTSQDILKDLKKGIESEMPTIESKNDVIILSIFLPSKEKKIKFNLYKEKYKTNEIGKTNDIKSLIQNISKKVDDLEKENNKIYEEINIKKEEIESIINEIEDKFKGPIKLTKKNFHWISDEVNIVNNSTFLENFSPEIMIGKDKSKPYSLTEGNKNHYVEFSFKRIYFLKSIRIKVDTAECSLKTFKIDVINNNGVETLGPFTRKKYKSISDFQEFEINRESKGIKMILIDNWGNEGGNYILIAKIEFNVSD